MTIPTVSHLTNIGIFQFKNMARSKRKQRTRYTTLKRPRKTTRQSWGERDMKMALQAVRGEISGEQRMGYLSAAMRFNVPKSTLERRNKGQNKIASGSSKFLGNIKSVLPTDLEEELVAHILLMEERGFGLTYVDTRKLAFELAEDNNIDHKFNKDDRMAGKYWLYGFLRRHPQLSLRVPENTSLARAVSFNKGNVNKFFDLLEKTLKENPNIGPGMIFNCDETGLTTVPNHPPKIVGLTNKKQVGTVSSAERGVNTTALLTVNALGNTVPPWFVFPRVKQNPQLMIGAAEGSVQDNHISGWMQNDIFYRWAEWFIKHTKCTKENKALLILDGHATHVKSIKLINLARENGLIIIALPPHCTHRLQVLDVSCMKPLSSNFAIEVQQWLRQNAGTAVTIYQVAALFTRSYLKSLTPENIISGFKKTGIWPFDRTVFDHLFTENTAPVSDENVNTSALDLVGNSAISPIPISGNPGVVTSTPITAELQDVAEPNGTEDQLRCTLPHDDENTSNRVLPKDLMPVPVLEYKKSKSKGGRNRAGKTAVITASPYLKDLTLVEENRKLLDENKELKRLIRGLKKGTNLPNSRRSKTTATSARKKLFSDIKRKQKASPRKRRNRVLNLGFSDSEPDTAEAALAEDSNLAEGGNSEPENAEPEDTEPEDTEPENGQSLEEGTYILVEFTGRSGVGSFYIGCVAELNGEMVRTRFLRRSDLKKNGMMKFRELTETDEEDMFGEHTKKQIKLILLPPIQHKGTARTARSLVFHDDRLENFAQYIE